MPREKFKQKLLKHRICAVARVVACVSFLMLTVIGVSSLVRAMSLDAKVSHQDGIPTAWAVGSLSEPETITVPITYWDQKADTCGSTNQQFEWVDCGYWTKGVLAGLVESDLGADGLPVPTFKNSTDAWDANHDVFTMNVTAAHNPVQSGDNFYRWFHEVSGLSKQVDSKITFTRTGSKKYEYGGQNIFPLDNETTLGDKKWAGKNGDHNFHFTAHLQFAIKVNASGEEYFHFSGDDDVWVYLNDKLVLDIGGLHEAIEGWFRINQDGTLTTFVEKVNDVSVRNDDNTSCMKNARGDFNTCTNPFNILISGMDGDRYVHESNMHNVEVKTLDIGLTKDDVVNLDFFYAERSTTESNTHITITGMDWPISADSTDTGYLEGKVGEDTESNLVEYITSIRNREPGYPLTLERLASYIHDEYDEVTATGETKKAVSAGFIPLNEKTLSYKRSLDDPEWIPVEISAPSDSEDGFKLKTPITMGKAGEENDTLYFRFFAETSPYNGTITNRTSFYTELNGLAGVTYDHDILHYTGNGSGESGKKDDDTEYTVTVTYRIVPDEDDDPSEIPDAPQTVVEHHKDGEEYSIPSKDVEGYEPDYKVVEGFIDGADVTKEVVYRKKQQPAPGKHKVTIHYVKNDGSEAFPDLVEEVEDGKEFSHTPGSLGGYTHSPENIYIEEVTEDVERTVYYTPIVEEHTVTVHYVYQNGSKALDDYVGTYKEGEKFSITSPTITGYRRDIAVVEGVMHDKDREFTVTYTMIDQPVGPNPVIPSNPSTPSTPSQPNTPNEPEPDDNLIPSIPTTPSDDDDLSYLEPLGEVAYVPNTGLISDVLSPIFDQYFAEMILSQGFVLTMLLIFAGSFSTYFSLRKYLDLAVMPASTRGMAKMPKMPKSVGNSKAARKMQKNAKRK